MNPNRKCGYCDLLDKKQPDLKTAIEFLPDPKNYENYDRWGAWGYTKELQPLINKAMPKIREYTENCPACIMATFRQRGIPVPMATGFDFKEECEKIWNAINTENYENEMASQYYY